MSDQELTGEDDFHWLNHFLIRSKDPTNVDQVTILTYDVNMPT